MGILFKNEREDATLQFLEKGILGVDLSKTKRIGRFEYDGKYFHLIIEDGKATVTDKETGEVFERLAGQKTVKVK